MLPSLLKPLIAQASQVYTDNSEPIPSFTKFFASRDAGLNGFQKMVHGAKVKPLKPLLNELRVFKSVAEVANMRLVGKVSGRAITNAMRQQWSREKDLGAFLDYN